MATTQCCFCSINSKQQHYSIPSLKPNPNLRFLRHPRRYFPRNIRFGSVVAAAVSEKNAIQTKPVNLTYLEGNSWLWDFGGLNILVDPVLVGNLDFGIPWLYDGAKKFIKNYQLKDLPDLDCLLITQGIDDHCHVKTLKPLSEMQPAVPVVSTPNAESLLSPLFSNVTYIEPGQSSELQGKNNTKLTIQATTGAVVGPPWQRPENGYIISQEQSQLSLYYEPHCIFDDTLLEKVGADVVITPVIKQLLPSFTLVSGQEDAVKLAKLLKAKYVVVMNNGDLDGKGILSSIIGQEGTVASFKQLLTREVPDAQVLEPTPGVPLQIPLPSKV